MDIDVTAFDIYMVEEYKETKEPKPRKPNYKYRCPCCNKELKSTEEELIVSCVDCDCEYVKVSK